MTNVRDTAFKKVLEEPELFIQFLEDFVEIDLLKGIKSEDVEDVSERFLPLISENKDGDTIKRIKIKGQGEPLYVIGIIEHQSHNNFRMSFRMLQYIVYVLEDYEKEVRGQSMSDPTMLKNFRYPPVLPIVFYDGIESWTAETNFKDRVHLKEIFDIYIPSFEYMVINLSNYTREDLISHGNILSLVMIIDKLKSSSEFKELKDLPKEYLENLESKTPQHILETLKTIVDLLLRRINVGKEEREVFTDRIKRREITDMFAWADGLDIQAERRKTEEQRKETEAERKKAEAERKKAEAERKKAEAEKRKAEFMAQRAEAESKKVTLLENKLIDAENERKKAELRVKELEALLNYRLNEEVSEYTCR